MTDILLISDSPASINVAWRHFCYREYNANATVSVETAMEYLKSEKPPQVVIYYCSGESCGEFLSFFRILREDEKTSHYPLIVLTDVELQKALAEYVRLEKTQVLGISVNDKTLMDVIRNAARNRSASSAPSRRNQR